MVPGVAALDGEVVAKSTRGERTIAARDFFQGIMTTALADDELLVEARLPLLPAGRALRILRIQPPRRRLRHGHGARRLSRRRPARSIEPRLAVGGAEPNPRRIAEAERALTGAAPGDEAFRAAARRHRGDRSMEDITTSAEFRRDLVLAVTRRALERAAQS